MSSTSNIQEEARNAAHAAKFLEVEKIRRLPRPPQEDVLDVIFPHHDREEWVADWGLTGGEVDILLGADMIHLFPKLDYTVEKLSLYMRFLTKRYIVMGQLPDNALEEQLQVIRRFSKEHSGAGRRLINLPRLGYTPTQPPRRRASPGTALRGPGGRGASSDNPAVSGTALGQAFMASSAPAVPIRPAPPPTDVPPTIVRRLPPSQRPPRAGRAGPPHWPYPWQPPDTLPDRRGQRQWPRP